MLSDNLSFSLSVSVSLLIWHTNTADHFTSIHPLLMMIILLFLLLMSLLLLLPINDGSMLRLAVDNMQYLTGVLGIKDHIHKQKIALKAMDVVLFGPPRGE